MSPAPLIFTRHALREIDRRAAEEYHIPILVLMENAGRAVADLAQRLTSRATPILIVAGPGNNGGDGLVAARHLAIAGHPVQILLLPSKAPPSPPAPSLFDTQLAITTAMGIPTATLSPDHAELRDYLVDAPPTTFIIDALFGTGLTRPLTGLPRDVIALLNASHLPILAIDIPSGLDTDTGLPLASPTEPGIAIIAAHTVSFCGTKLGFRNPQSKKYTGKITPTNISVPLPLLESLATK